MGLVRKVMRAGGGGKGHAAWRAEWSTRLNTAPKELIGMKAENKTPKETVSGTN